jgi:hypothetical protein
MRFVHIVIFGASLLSCVAGWIGGYLAGVNNNGYRPYLNMLDARMDLAEEQLFGGSSDEKPIDTEELDGRMQAIESQMTMRPPRTPLKVDVRRIPDVVIEREMFRRVGMLSADTCTYCKEKWVACECEMGKHPLMFQNREKQQPEFIKAELLKYQVKE